MTKDIEFGNKLINLFPKKYNFMNEILSNIKLIKSNYNNINKYKHIINLPEFIQDYLFPILFLKNKILINYISNNDIEINFLSKNTLNLLNNNLMKHMLKYNEETIVEMILKYGLEYKFDIIKNDISFISISHDIEFDFRNFNSNVYFASYYGNLKKLKNLINNNNLNEIITGILYGYNIKTLDFLIKYLVKNIKNNILFKKYINKLYILISRYTNKYSPYKLIFHFISNYGYYINKSLIYDDYLFSIYQHEF
jgi:hypothetical protein